MVQNELFWVNIEYYEKEANASLSLKWMYEGQPEINIPSGMIINPFFEQYHTLDVQ